MQQMILVMSKFLPTNFFDKEKYVIHYENLQLYLRLGLKLKKTRHHVLESVTMVETIC